MYLSDALHFCDTKLTLFGVSTTSGLLPDVFQWVSVHPIPIEICYGLLRYALTRLSYGFWQVVCALIISPCSDCSDFTPFLLLIHRCNAI